MSLSFPTSKRGRILELCRVSRKVKDSINYRVMSLGVFGKLVNSSHQHLADKVLDEFYFFSFLPTI